jgi:predicted Holliday junction resolvase-like endonuclease
MYTFIFYIQKLENKLALVKKELQRARKDNQVLARYINTRRKKEESWRKGERLKRRRLWWSRDSMRGKAPKISGLIGSSPPMVV